MNEVEEIKNRLDIVEVISAYVPLKQAGRNFKALSPFHQEKTPSFMVSPEKNIWHDFSSGQGGDIFSFVMKMEGVDFREALEMLARRAGVALQPRSKAEVAKSKHKTTLYEVMDKAVGFYHQQLANNPQALQYLAVSRRLNKDTIKTFHLGYAPDSWEALSQFLESSGFDNRLGKLAGLVGQKAGRSNTYDLFRDRIMFPIYDMQGRAIGFSARLLSAKDDAPKYINTPESPIYHKGQAIYGLSQSKEAIRKADEVIVVEGNMDVLSLYQAGQMNVVAVSGTSLTVDQLKILARLSKNIKLCLDSDEAGQKATLRGVELASGLNLTLSIIRLGPAKDPDELISSDKKAWTKAVKAAVYGMDFVFEQAASQFDATSGLGKRKFASFVLPFVAQLADTVERDHYAKKLAQALDVEETTIRRKLSGKSTVKQPEKKSDNDQTNTISIQQKLTKIESLELAMLELFLPFPVTRAAVDEIVLADISPRFEPYFAEIKAHPKATLDKTAKNLRQWGNTAKIIALRGEQEYSSLGENDLRLEAYTQVNRWQKEIREVNKRRLTRLIAQAEERGDVLSAEKYLANYQTILSEES